MHGLGKKKVGWTWI